MHTVGFPGFACEQSANERPSSSPGPLDLPLASQCSFSSVLWNTAQVLPHLQTPTVAHSKCSISAFISESDFQVFCTEFSITLPFSSSIVTPTPRGGSKIITWDSALWWHGIQDFVNLFVAVFKKQPEQHSWNATTTVPTKTILKGRDVTSAVNTLPLIINKS